MNINIDKYYFFYFFFFLTLDYNKIKNDMNKFINKEDTLNLKFLKICIL